MLGAKNAEKMNCPNCNAPNLRTYETFQTTDITYRTKRCTVCEWKFTSKEEIPYENVVIPNEVKRKKAKK
jgi:transcriptional regulator NrdR family protein